MEQEEKELLLKDLCARIPYEVKVHRVTPIGIESVELLGLGWIEEFYTGECELKPYLRPMSSMTKEEVEELNNIVDKELKDSEPYFVYEQLTVDFYLSHHLDNRLMIEKGLALEAPEGMYNIK